MSVVIKKSFAIRSIEDRLQQKLPIKTKDDEAYFGDRFYWAINMFIKQYFVSEKILNRDEVLDQMFSFINSGIGNLNLSKLHDFKIALACSLYATADVLGYSVKVPSDFFVNEFLRVVDQRFKRQTASLRKHAGYLIKVLVKAGLDHDKAIELIEAKVMIVEKYPHYAMGTEKFVREIIYGILYECKQLNIAVTNKQLSRYVLL